MESKGDKLLYILITALFISTIYDPSNEILKIKTILFAVVFLTYVYINYKNINKKKMYFTTALVIGVPICYTIIGYSNNTFNIEIALNAIKSFLYFFIIFVIYKGKDLYLKNLRIVLLGIPIIILITHIFLMFNEELFYIVYFYTLKKGTMIIATTRSFGSIEMPSIYYKTVILTVIPYSYHFQKFLYNKNKKYLNLFLSFLFGYGLIMSGTRATMLSLFIITVYWLVIYFKDNIKAKYIVLLGVIGTTVLIYLIINFFDRTETSNSIKIGHYKSYISHFKNMNLFWGDGLGTSFYTGGLKSQVYITELTYFEMLRRFGIIGFLFYTILLLFPLTVLYKNKYILSWYPIYLFAAGTNPLLFSSTGMLLLAFVYAEGIEVMRSGEKHERKKSKNPFINV